MQVAVAGPSVCNGKCDELGAKKAAVYSVGLQKAWVHAEHCFSIKPNRPLVPCSSPCVLLSTAPALAVGVGLLHSLIQAYDRRYNGSLRVVVFILPDCHYKLNQP